MLRNNEQRGQIAYAIFLSVSIFSLAYALFNLLFSYQLRGVGPETINTTEIQVFGWINQLAIVTNLGLLLASIISFMTWSRRAYYNLTAVGAETDFTDQHAIIAWFLPVTSLYRPYQIIREIWQITQRQAFGHITPHTLLRIWWALYLIRAVLSIIVTAASSTLTIEAIRTSLQFTACALVVDAVAAYVTARVIRRITGFEHQLALGENIERLGQAAPEPTLLTPTDHDLYL